MNVFFGLYVFLEIGNREMLLGNLKANSKSPKVNPTNTKTINALQYSSPHLPYTHPTKS